MSPKLSNNITSEDCKKINDSIKECWDIIKQEIEKKKELKNAINNPKIFDEMKNSVYLLLEIGLQQGLNLIRL